MIKTELIIEHNGSSDYLDAKINKFLVENPTIRVIDIKFQVLRMLVRHPQDYVDEWEEEREALIIYDDKPQKGLTDEDLKKII